MDDLVADKGRQLESKGEGEFVEQAKQTKLLSATSIVELIEKQRYRCALTGKELQPEVAHLDHKIPLSRGGSHSVANLHVVHSSVNTAKGTMTVEEFVEMCVAVAEHFRR